MKNVTSSSPGVYLFKNKSGTVLYVGKASNLRARLSNYFQKDLTPRQGLLMKEATKLDTIEVDSEMEALILEANLIKKFQPNYNVQLKDDKDYLYLKIVKEKFPRVLLARKRGLTDAKEFFGPYPSASSLRSTLRSLRPVFPFRTCKINQGRACFSYHLGLCPGVCIGKISEKEYAKNITKLKLFFLGNKHKLITRLQKEMEVSSKKQEYEKAHRARKSIEAINFITRPMRRVDEYVEAESIDDIRQVELITLGSLLKVTKKLNRIECYDISNFQGSFPVGSMVVIMNGAIDKQEYRHFKIQDFDAPNDPGMMGEMIRRRLNNPWPLPDLIIVDGGKTQLAAAVNAIKGSGKNIPAIGLAKRNEEIHTVTGEIIRLPKDSPAIYLITRIRDEAHRFAITFYRKLAAKALTAK